jgi:sugar phosphate isomerase/epimerase
MLFGATLNLGPPRASLPYLYSDSLQRGCEKIAAAGFQAVDILPPYPESLHEARADTFARYGLRLGGVATGGAWFAERLHLASPDARVRQRAQTYVHRCLDLAAGGGGSVILGLVAGIVEPGVTRETALGRLTEGVAALARDADRIGAGLLLEPLNKAESNLLNRLQEAQAIMDAVGSKHVGILADFFHMAREEDCAVQALRQADGAVRHIHFVDDNRQAPGFGQTDFAPLAHAVREIGFKGCMTVEALPLPDSERAARRSIEALNFWFGDVREGGTQ